MQTGEFLERFFIERQPNFDIKMNGEADVLCPFPHDKGYETRPSAHINKKMGVFHCKTCQAEGRFNNGGLSEIEFVARLHNITYAQSVKMLSQMNKNELIADVAWETAATNLMAVPEVLEFLTQKRGLTHETIVKYQLGELMGKILYPVWLDLQIWQMFASTTRIPDPMNRRSNPRAGLFHSCFHMIIGAKRKLTIRFW